MGNTLLVVNAGSSSIKFQLFRVQGGQRLELAFKGQMEGIGSQPHLIARDGAGTTLIDERYDPAQVGDGAAALGQLDDWLIAQLGGVRPLAIGHRVVHGGPAYSAPILVDDVVLGALERLVPLAPLHQPANLAPIREIRRRYPEIPQVACFDTAFHRGHPEVADRFAIADELVPGGRAPLRLSRPVLRVHRRPPARAGSGAWQRAGWWSAIWARAPRCARSGTAAAWTARWASPPSTACRWAPAPASSTRG